MHLIYFDESGNTGNNLNDPQQPLFVLCALAVPESAWLNVERDLSAQVQQICPPGLPDNVEIHATDLMSGRNWCRAMPIANRLVLRDRWFAIAAKHDLKIIYRAIVKKRFERWVHGTFGTGITINPHVAAFPLVARVVNDWLRSLPGSPLGVFISDENKEIVRDVEKSIKVLRGIQGILKLSQVIEKGFFIDSSKSIVLQLCDLCALHLRKHEEAKAGFCDKAIFHDGIRSLEPLIHRGDEALQDVLDWITDEEKKKRPGTMS